MIFVEQLRIGWQGRFKQRTQLFERLSWTRKIVTFENSPRIRIDHKHRVTAAVKKDRIRRLRTNSMNREQLRTQCGSRRSKHARKRPAICFKEERSKSFELLGLLPKVA